MIDSGQPPGLQMVLGASVIGTASFLITARIRNNDGSGPLLRRRQGCLQRAFCRACGACGEGTDACNPRSAGPAVPAVTAATTRMHAIGGLPCLYDLGGPGSRWSRNGFILYNNYNTRWPKSNSKKDFILSESDRIGFFFKLQVA